MNTRFIILGALPPPRGGVSTHLERLLPYMDEEGLSYVVWDHSTIHKKRDYLICMRREPLKLLRSFFTPERKILYHPLSQVTPFKVLGLLLMRLTGTRLILYLVASPKQTLGKNHLKRISLLALARVSSQVIAANGDFHGVLTQHGIRENKISLIPPFIPLKDAFAKEPPLSSEAEEFCRVHTPVIMTYANGPDLHDGQDLYGLDLIIELAKKLRERRPDAGFVVVIPEVTNERHFAEIRSAVQKSGLDFFFHFAVGNNVSFIRFLPYTDVFVRATNTDGDSLALREALYYGVPAVASDISYRPEGTRLFCSRNADDLCRAIEETLEKGGKGSGRAGSRDGGDHAARFVSVFRQVAGLSDG